MKIPRLNKKGIIIFSATAIVILFALIIIFGDRKGIYPEYTSYSTLPNGCKAIYLLTEQMGYDAARYDRPSRFLPDSTVMIAVNPQMNRYKSNIEQKYLEQWVEKGNTLLIADYSANFNQYVIFKNLYEENTVNNFRFFKKGHGKVIYCSDLKCLTNKGLRNSQNGVDFIGLLDNEGKKTVLFNEYYHGFGAEGVSISDLLGQSGFLVIIQVVLGVVLLLVLSAFRFGKPVTVFQIVKRMENENLFALSNLYIKTKSNALVLKIHLDRMKNDLSGFLGSNTMLEDAEIIRISGGNKFLAAFDLKGILNACSYYIDKGSISNKKLYGLIEKLEEIRKEII